MVLDSSGLYVLRRARKPAARQHATIGCPKSDAVNRLFKKDAINVTQQTYHANGAPAAFRAMRYRGSGRSDARAVPNQSTEVGGSQPGRSSHSLVQKRTG